MRERTVARITMINSIEREIEKRLATHLNSAESEISVNKKMLKIETKIFIFGNFFLNFHLN